MSDYRSTPLSRGQTQVQYDAGLRSYMLGVYNYMALGVAVTAAVVLGVASNPAVFATVSSLSFLFFFAILGLGFAAPRMIFSGNTTLAHTAFWSYCGLWGLMMAPMVAHYLAIQPQIVMQAFFITAATFAGTSLAGYVTKRDLSGLRGFFLMAVIGILIVMLVNLFFIQSTTMSLVTSLLVVLLFSGITAYKTQMIKEMYVEGDAAGVAKGKSIFGAFALYGSFVTLFVHILNILGIMRTGD
jgi:uncharacterized protein